MELIIAAFALQCFFTPLYTFKWFTKLKKVRIPNLFVKMLASSAFVLAACGALIYTGGFTDFSRIMFWGFLLSWIGDLLLNMTNQILVGVGGFAFLSAHVFYIGAYTTFLTGRYSVPFFNAVDVSVWLVLLVGVFIVSGLKILKPGALLRVGVMLYGGVITLMVIKAVHLAVCALSGGVSGSAVFALLLIFGSVFFLISDFSLLFIMFGGMDNTKMHAVNLFPYFFGQMLLACTMMFTGA